MINAGTTSTSTTTTTPSTTTTTTTTPPPPPLTLSVAQFVVGKARSGRLFDAVMIVFREDTGDPLSGGKLACAARIGTKPLRLSSKAGPKIGLSLYEWKLAKTAKGKRLTGTIKVTFQGVSVTRAFARKVS